MISHYVFFDADITFIFTPLLFELFRCHFAIDFLFLSPTIRQLTLISLIDFDAAGFSPFAIELATP
jgi:hypothetical protein